jgi:hypothetical protein
MPTLNETWEKEDAEVADEFREQLDELTNNFKEQGWVVFASPQGFEEEMISDAQLGLDKVRINKNKLLEKLRENLEKHQSEFKKSLAGWKIEAIEAMTKNLQLAKDDSEFNLSIHLDRPHDHSEDYRHVISLLSASEDDIVVISANEFRQYHDDQWRWKGSHTEALMNYSAKLR